MKKCKYHCDYGDGEFCHYKGNTECVHNEKKINELIPCPFCGNKNLEVTRKSEGFHYELGTGYIVRCNFLNGGCGANGGARATEELAIEAWNCRNRK